jgi:hypothetical protein
VLWRLRGAFALVLALALVLDFRVEVRFVPERLELDRLARRVPLLELVRLGCVIGLLLFRSASLRYLTIAGPPAPPRQQPGHENAPATGA